MTLCVSWHAAPALRCQVLIFFVLQDLLQSRMGALTRRAAAVPASASPLSPKTAGDSKSAASKAVASNSRSRPKAAAAKPKAAAAAKAPAKAPAKKPTPAAAGDSKSESKDDAAAAAEEEDEVDLDDEQIAAAPSVVPTALGLRGQFRL
jgi:hypothetical protein